MVWVQLQEEKVLFLFTKSKERAFYCMRSMTLHSSRGNLLIPNVDTQVCKFNKKIKKCGSVFIESNKL